MAASIPAQSTVNTTPGSELTVAILESELAPVAAKWEILGRKLGLPDYRLEIIAADCPLEDGAAMRRLSTVLREWRKNVPDGSWSDIISALRDMEENTLTRKIEIKHCSTAQGQQEQTEEALALARTNEITLKARFAELQVVVYQRIQRRLDAKQFEVRDFRVYMTALFPPQENIPETTDVSEIFTAITRNALWDYLNFEPLEKVAKMYGGSDPTMMAKLEEYSQALVGYKMAKKMVDYLSDVPVPSRSEPKDDGISSSSPVRRDQNFRRELRVKLKLPVSEQSLSYIDEIWKQLAKRFLIPPASAILEKITEGSLYITWLIPTFFLVQMMEMAEQPEIVKVFQEMEAELITVDGVCLYKAQEHDKLHDTENISILLREQEDSDSDAFDDDQEPPPKLATATQEENADLVADQPQEIQPCTTCKRGFKSTHQCIQCGGSICDQCTEMHKVGHKAFEGHHPVKLDDTTGRVEECSKHSKMLDLFCTDSGCQCCICSQCTMPGEDHAGHNCIPIAEAVVKYRQKFCKKKTQIQQLKKKVSDHISHIESCKAKLHQQYKKMPQKIQTMLESMIDKFPDEYQAHLDKSEMEEAAVLDEHCNALKRASEELENLLKYVNKLVESDTDILEAMSLKKPADLETHINELLEKHGMYQLQHYSTTKRMPDAQQVLSFIMDHTKVAVVNPPDPSKCSYEGPDVAKSNQKICCRVLLVDSKSRPCRTPHDVRVIFTPRTGDMGMEPEVVNKSGNEYQVLFTPKTRGNYSVTVTVNKTQIPGSPFKILVTLPPRKIGIHGPVREIPVPNMEEGPTRLSFIRETGFAVSGKPAKIMNTTGDKVRDIKYQAKLTGIECDHNENVYAVAISKSRLVKFAPSGEVLKEIGSEGSDPGQFRNPAGICIHNEEVIVADSDNARLQFFNQDLKFIRTFHGDNQYCLCRPQGVTFDGKGAMYVADGGNRCIQKFQDDKLIQMFGMECMQNPMEVVLDRSKKYVLVSDYDGNSVFVYDTGGRYVHSFGGKGSDIEHPIGLAMDGDGYLWVCDFLNNKLKGF